MNTAKREGRAEGRAEERVEIARKMKAKGFTASEVSEMTGLNEEEIKAL